MAVAGTGGGSITPFSILGEGLVCLGVDSPLSKSSGRGVLTLADSGVDKLDELGVVSDDVLKLMMTSRGILL